ncbi:MAG: class I SAM-dependent methyltransferase [Deltaproteobacteria bacterium]|nr:class I SAM-dependent methyltransferase [Deltaproteobacteria bacterium]
MSPSRSNRFQEFFEDDKYIALKNYLYNYLLRKKAIETVLQNEKKELVLEVGSGISPILTEIDSLVYSDISMLAMRTLRQMRGRGKYVVADGIGLPFRNGVFSHVISSEVLEHLEDDRKALSEISRVMKPSGVLVITFPHRRFYFSYDDRFVQHVRRYELSEMEDRLREVGLYPELVRKVLGPLEKITMCIVLSCVAVMQRLHMGRQRKVKSTELPAVLSSSFKWINRLYAGLARLDAIIMPRALSTVLLIRAVKR